MVHLLPYAVGGGVIIWLIGKIGSRLTKLDEKEKSKWEDMKNY